MKKLNNKALWIVAVVVIAVLAVLAVGSYGRGPASEKTCYGEGEGIMGLVTPDVPNLPCCTGLQQIDDSAPSGNNECVATEGFICSNCGDGICGRVENRCNCPADCK